MAQKTIECGTARCEAHEVPFGKVYDWHPARVECDCGEQLNLIAISADVGSFVHDLRERESPLLAKLMRPWFHDAEARADRRLRDEAAYSEGSSWHYDDATADTG